MESSFVEEIILESLEKADNPLTILEVAEKTRMHRVTASKYLAVLEAKGHVKRRDVGKAKLYSTTGNASIINVKKEEVKTREEEE